MHSISCSHVLRRLHVHTTSLSTPCSGRWTPFHRCRRTTLRPTTPGMLDPRKYTSLLKASAKESKLGNENPEEEIEELDFSLDGEIPDFDDLILDDAFYEKIGVNKEVLDKHPPWAPEYTDPQGYNVTFDDYLKNREDIPDYIKSDLRDAQYFGPPVLLLAGFRLEELPLVRLTVDKLVGEDVKVIPIFGQEVLEMKVEDALRLPEPDWEKPRPEDWIRGGTWGSQRTILFGGLSMESQASVIEVIEESGLPPICVTIASEQTRHFQVGQLMADAIRLQRDRKNPDKQLWEGDRVIKDVSDLKRYVNKKIKLRMDRIKTGLEKGTAKLEPDPATGTMTVKMDGMEEEIFDPEEISQPLESESKDAKKSKKLSSTGRETADKTSTETKSKTVPRFCRPSSFLKPSFETDASDEENGRFSSLDEAERDASNEATRFREMESDRFLTPEEMDIAALTENLDDPLSDYFAVDDLVNKQLGMRPPPRPTKTEIKTDNASVEMPTESIKGSSTSGRVYPMSSEPEAIEENVKRNTVFSGLVKDPAKFMKDNFGYDESKKAEAVSEMHSDVETIDVTTLEQQEALEGRFGNVGQPDVRRNPSMESVIRQALDAGIAPEKLSDMIRALSEESQRPTFRKRFRRG